MSHAIPSREQTNGHVRASSPLRQQGATNADPENGTPITAAHFGMLDGEVQGEVQKLRERLSTIETVSRLAITFEKYGKVVRTVDKRHGTDQALEHEIRELEVATEFGGISIGTA